MNINKPYQINILINRLNLFSLIDYVNETVTGEDDDGYVTTGINVQLLLSIQPDDHNILVQSNDERLYDIMYELGIGYSENNIDLDYQENYWKSTLDRPSIQSSSNSENDYSYSRNRSPISEEE